jgi:hypothetical protein
MCSGVCAHFMSTLYPQSPESRLWTCVESVDVFSILRMLSFPVPVARAYTRRVSCQKAFHGTLIKSIQWYAACMSIRGHVPSGVHEVTRGWASLRAIVHLYPHTSPLPVSCLAQFTNKSFVTFCKKHLYGSHAFAGRKVAYYSRYSIGTPCSSFIIISTEEKQPVLHTRAKEGFDDSSCVRFSRP